MVIRVVLSHRKPAPAGTSRDSCHAPGHCKRNSLFSNQNLYRRQAMAYTLIGKNTAYFPQQPQYRKKNAFCMGIWFCLTSHLPVQVSAHAGTFGAW
jgi:hypothetical protein